MRADANDLACVRDSAFERLFVHLATLTPRGGARFGDLS
jgi:hypothetical protein